MAVEVERKFLVVNDCWRGSAHESRHMVDHLVARFERGKVRIRLCDGAATLTFKGQRRGFSRSEYHIDLPEEEAASMVEEFAAVPALEKRRHEVDVHGLTWQVDEFLGPLRGLVTADVELPHEGHEPVMPDWAGQEITRDPRFSSGTLAILLEQGDRALAQFLASVRRG